MPDTQDAGNSSTLSGAVTSVTSGMNDVQRGLAWFITTAFVVLIFVWVFRPPVMAPESMAQLNQLVSTLQNILLIAIGFFFGSSKSSQNKDDIMMKKATDTPLAPVPGLTPQAPTPVINVVGDGTNVNNDGAKAADVTTTPAAAPLAP
jgi:hypothetical protein